MCSNGGRPGAGLLLPAVHRGPPRLSGTTVPSCVWTSGDRLSDGGLSFPVGAASPPPVASSAVQTKNENERERERKLQHPLFGNRQNAGSVTTNCSPAAGGM